MEITTLSNLVSLAIEVSGLGFEANDAKLSEEEFNQVVTEIFNKIDMLQKWKRDGRTHFQLLCIIVVSYCV